MVLKSQQQIFKIYEMLFEMANGNLLIKVDEIFENADLNHIIKNLNSVAEKLNNSISTLGYVKPLFTNQIVLKFTIVLNSDFKIINFSQNLQQCLGYTKNNLLKTDFNKIIANESLNEWKEVVKQLNKDKRYQETILLIFKDSSEMLLPYQCTIYRLSYNEHIYLSTLSTILKEPKEGFTNFIPRKTEVEIIQKVYDYILNNLDEPLPNLQELSKLFGTNEFKLKDGFKHLYNTSIYKFYNKQRLQKAHSLIQYTHIQLKEIAFMCGFNDYANFSKAFKKKYLYSPNKLKRSEDSNLTTF